MNRFKKIFQYGLLYLSGLWLLFRWWNRRRLLIVMYHGVAERTLGAWTLIPPRRFDEQIDYLSRRYRIIDLESAVEQLQSGRPPTPYTAVITFDDGFRNNLTEAYPVLRKYNVPATIFLTTSLIDADPKYRGLLWPDYVHCLISRARADRIDLTDLGLGLVYLGSMPERYEQGIRLCEYLKTVSDDEKDRIIEIIAERTGGIIPADDLEVFGGLSWDDVRRMEAEGLVSFGAHSVSHPILSRLRPEAMEKEIIDSQKIVAAHVNRPITTFAYPNGKKEDYTDETVAVVSKHFRCALTTNEGLNRSGADLWELQRVGPGSSTSIWEFKLLTSQAITIYYRLLGFLGR